MTDNFGLGDVGSVLSDIGSDLGNVNVNINPFGGGYGGGMGGMGWGWSPGFGYSSGFFVNNSIIASLFRAIFGIALLIAALWMVHWNEGKAVDLQRTITERVHNVVELDPHTLTAVSGEKLIHIAGWIEGASPLLDPLFNVRLAEGVSLRRKVEMYQWIETGTKHRDEANFLHQNATTVDYQKGWSEKIIDSGVFRYPKGHENPLTFPPVEQPVRTAKGWVETSTPLTPAVFDAPAVTLGAYKVSPEIINAVTNATPVLLNQAAPSGFTLTADNMFYRGVDSADPKVGDARVSFEAIDAEPIGMLGGLDGDTLTGYHNGAPLTVVRPGTPTAQELFKSFHQNQLLTWGYRGLAFVMIFISFMMIAAPLTTMAEWIPFLGALVEVSVFFAAFLFAVPVTLTAIGLAWVGQRPVIAAVLFTGSITLTLILFHRRLAYRRHEAEVHAFMAQKAAHSHAGHFSA